MNSKSRTYDLIRLIVIFVVLVVAGAGMTAGASRLPNPADQAVLMHLGSAMFAGSLAFFLVEIYRWERE